MYPIHGAVQHPGLLPKACLAVDRTRNRQRDRFLGCQPREREKARTALVAALPAAAVVPASFLIFMIAAVSFAGRQALGMVEPLMVSPAPKQLARVPQVHERRALLRSPHRQGVAPEAISVSVFALVRLQVALHCR